MATKAVGFKLRYDVPVAAIFSNSMRDTSTIVLRTSGSELKLAGMELRRRRSQEL
jgi:hypothetical protein